MKRLRAADLTRNVWDVEARAFPADSPIEDQARFLLRYAILAPSSHNSQPWRFAVDGGRIEVATDDRRWLSVADRDRRELHLSLGCAVENLLVAADRFGFDADLGYREADGDPIVVVTLSPDGGAPSDRSVRVFDRLTERHTSREPFAGRPLSDAVRATLRECVREADVSLHLIDDPGRKRAIGEMQAEADRALLADPEYRSELAHWIGLGALGQSGLVARISRTVVAHVDLGGREGRTNATLVGEAPVLGLLVASADDPATRVRAGQVYERLALAASVDGVAAHPLSQILERPGGRADLADLVGVDGVPQHLFRLGYPTESPTRTPRWPLEDVLDDRISF